MLSPWPRSSSTEPAHANRAVGKSRQKFTSEEDGLLVGLVKRLGEENWKVIAERIPGRTARQCRERYRYYLEPTLNRGNWTEVEDRLLTVKYTEHGPKWSKIAMLFVNRTPVDVKNRWHVIQRSNEKEVEEIEKRENMEIKRLPSIDTFLRELPRIGNLL